MAEEDERPRTAHCRKCGWRKAIGEFLPSTLYWRGNTLRGLCRTCKAGYERTRREGIKLGHWGRKV